MQKNKGFTLLEILIAIFIFTILALMTASGLRTLIASQEVTQKHSATLTELQLALLIFSRDIEQIVNRPISVDDKAEAALQGSQNTLLFTRDGFSNPFGDKRSSLQRVQYVVEKNKLLRKTWSELDAPHKNIPIKRHLLSNVEMLQIEYLDQENQFHAAWPIENTANEILPKAIRISLQIKNKGKITQFYLIPSENVMNETVT